MSSESTVRPVTHRHYQAVGGLALAAIFLVHVEHASASDGSILADLFILLVGAIGLLYRVRLSPILVLCAIAAPILAEQYRANQFNLELRATRTLDVGDVIMCIATLAYLIAQYRLHGLWFGVTPADPRLPKEESARSEASLSMAELLGLVVPIPAAALLAQLAFLLLRHHWSLPDLPPRWQQFVIIAWVLLITMFLAASGFRHWRRLQMSRQTALLLLQDAIWEETRGEQRSINRWLAWRRLRKSK